MSHQPFRSTIALAIGLAAVLGGCSSEDPPRSVHPLDTALLFPLPRTAIDDHLLRFDSQGAKGALLPSYATNQLPTLSAARNVDLLPTLRMVAANLDPCFPSGVEGQVDATGVSLCRKQVRLIFQPVHDDGTGTQTTDDVTVHSFYEMDEATFRQLVIDVRDARRTELADAAPIDIHPIMVAEGANGSYQRALQDVLLAYAGADNLVKVTFIGLRGGGIGWQMGGVDFQGTKPTDMTVPETRSTRQELVNNTAAGDLDASVDPVTKFSTGMKVLLDSVAARTASDDAVIAGFRQALRIDNPATDLNPGTVDCASCHLASPARFWAERNRALSAADFPESFTSKTWNLENRSQTKANTQSMRCFGYYGRDVAISQRTINEAAAVADFINDKILGGAR